MLMEQFSNGGLAPTTGYKGKLRAYCNDNKEPLRNCFGGVVAGGELTPVLTKALPAYAFPEAEKKPEIYEWESLNSFVMRDLSS